MLVATVANLVLQALHRAHDEAQGGLDFMGEMGEKTHLHLFNFQEMLHPLPDKENDASDQQDDHRNHGTDKPTLLPDGQDDRELCPERGRVHIEVTIPGPDLNGMEPPLQLVQVDAPDR